MVHPDDLDRTVKLWRNCLATGKFFEIEHRFKRGYDGEYRWHLGRALPVRDNEDNIIKWFGNQTDIDDYKKPKPPFLKSRRI